MFEAYEGKKIALDDYAHQHLISSLRSVCLELNVPERFIVLSLNNKEFEPYASIVKNAFRYIGHTGPTPSYYYMVSNIVGQPYIIMHLLAGMLIRNFQKTVNTTFSKVTKNETSTCRNLFINYFPKDTYVNLNDDMYSFFKVLSDRSGGHKTVLFFQSEEEKNFVLKAPQLRHFKNEFVNLES